MANEIPVSAQVTNELTHVVSLLASVNVAVPIIAGVAVSVIGIIKALKGTPPDLSAIIASIEQQVAQNKARGEAELARLRSLQ